MFGSHFDHLLTSPGSISVHEQLHIAQRKSNNDHGIFLHISTKRNTDKTFYQAIILHQALKRKNTGSLIIVHVDGRCKLKMRAESANDRTINLFSPRIKSSLQMSGVKDSQGLY